MAPAPPFFIVGSGRSGTTMLRLMLDAHPDVAVPAESHFVDELARRWPRYVRSGRIDPDAVVRSIGKRLDLMDIPRGEAREHLAALPTAAVGDAVDAVFRVYADAHGKSRWGDKTPGYVLSMPLLAEVFPGSRFVHLIRDGRDVALSYRDQPFGPRNVWEAARYWDKRVRAGRRHGAAIGPARYLELRYEDVVADPRAAVERLCSFLELAVDDRMVAFHRESAQKLPERRERWRGLYEPVSTRMRDWRTEMPEGEQRAFEAMAGELLEELGYERWFPKTAATTAARAFVARRRWEARGAWMTVRRKAIKPIKRKLGAGRPAGETE